MTVRFTGNLGDYAHVAHEVAKDKGWWDEERNFGEITSNIHSEVTEAWKEWVAGNDVDRTYYVLHYNPSMNLPEDLVLLMNRYGRWMNYVIKDGYTYPGDAPEELTKDEIQALVDVGVLEPHGVPTELADVIIRCLDLFEKWGLNPDEVVQEKMRYNMTRPHRHGGKRA